MQYRPEIDGLRAVAVLSVVLFHAEIKWFSGGFVGVDVFFVISGFLITSILRSDIEKGQFSPIKFYNHRIRRILPALICVLVVTTVFARRWMLPWQFDEYARSALAALTFWSNLFFWQTSGYFDIGVDEKPLLHTWSLSVEEQYYLMFPIALFMVWRLGRLRVQGLIVLVTLLSFALAEWGWRNYPQANFFLTPTRVWEILLGAIIGIMGKNSLSRTLSEAISFLGLGAIVLSILMLSKYNPSPSIYLLPALLGAVAILYCTPPNGITARLLSVRPLLGIGIVSYSFYLWHQPVFALYRIRFGTIDTVTTSVALIALALGLAVLSYWCIETPFRRRNAARFVISNHISTASIVAGVVGLCLTFAYFVIEIGNGQFRARDIVYSDALVDVRTERLRTWELYVRNPQLKDALAQFPDNAALKARIMIVGDSHAKDTFNALHQNETLFKGSSFRVAFFSDGCMDPKPPRTVTHTRDCLQTFTAQHAALFSEATHVLVSMNWVKMDTTDVTPILQTATEFFKEAGKTVVLTSNTPIFEPSSPFLIAKLFRQNTLDKVTADRTHFDNISAEVAQVNQVIEGIAREADATYLAKTDYICDPAQSTCHALTPEGHAIFPDNGHYTVEGARFFGQQMAKTGWLNVLD